MCAQPLISTIVPCYKQAGFLPETLASIQAQTFPDWEVIIVNDGSPDDTAAVAAEWVKQDARFRYVEKANGGLSSARNAGLAVAQGEYVHFLDSDDFMHPGFYAAALAKLRADPAAVGAYCGWTYVDIEGKRLGAGEVTVDARDWFHFLLEYGPCPCHAMFVKRAAVARIGGFDETLRSCEDWDAWLRIAAAGAQVARIPGHFAFYRRHGQSMTRSYATMLRAGYRVIRENGRAHHRCDRCRSAMRRGRLNYARYIWETTQCEPMRDLLAKGKMEQYLGLTLRRGMENRFWFWWNVTTLMNSKRMAVRGMLKRARLSRQ